MRAAKVDACQPEIVEALRKAGAMVLSLAAVGKGCPDVLCEYAGRLYLLELKSLKGRLTFEQVIFHQLWKSVQVVHDPIEALQAIGAIESESEI